MRCGCGSSSTGPLGGKPGSSRHAQWRQDNAPVPGCAPAAARSVTGAQSGPARGTGRAHRRATPRASIWAVACCWQPCCSSRVPGGAPVLFARGPSPGGRRGVVADPAGGSGHGLPSRWRGGPTGQLGRRTTSFRQWALRLAEHAAAGGFDDELEYWAGVGQGRRPVLPADGAGANTVGLDARGHGARWAATRPRRCCSRCRGVPHPGQRRAAGRAGRVLAGWTGRRQRAGGSGGPRPRGALRRGGPVPHGGLVHHACSRWRWTCPPGRAGAALKSVKEQLRAVPGRGLGYGAAALPQRDRTPGAALGLPARRSASTTSASSTGRPPTPAALYRAPGGLAGDAAREAARAHLLDVIGRGRGRVAGAHLDLLRQACTTGHRASAWPRTWSQALREIVAHCAQPGRGRLHAPRTSRWLAWTRPRWTGWRATAAASRTSTR